MVHLRDAQAEDAGLISHIYATSWRKAYKGLIAQDYLDRLPDEYWVPSIRSWLADGRFQSIMAYLDKCPVGCAICGRGRDEDHSDWGEIVSIYILPEHTRHGAGSALLAESLRRLRLDGFQRFYLWAIEGNAAADAFYRRHGFRATGDRVAYQIGGGNVADRRYVLVGDAADQRMSR